MVRPERFELPTPCFVGKCSIQLSYGRIEGFAGSCHEQFRMAYGGCQRGGWGVLDLKLNAEAALDLFGRNHLDGVPGATVQE